MADVLFSRSSVVSRLFLCMWPLVFISNTRSALVFQPSYRLATGPTVTTYLLGNATDISLKLRTVSPSNTTGRLPPPSCVEESKQWILSKELVGKTITRVQLRLNRSLYLCGDQENETDCCPKPLCVLEALQMSACLGDTPQASMLIQAEIYALFPPTNFVSDNKTVIPNQVYHPLGPCPCDLTVKMCDIRCCCDKDCSSEDLKLFEFHCLPGPFGGHISPTPDYHCSVQSAENAPDWFPFLCVSSPPENNPYLGQFYQGKTITPKPCPSFQRTILSAPIPTNDYRQGSPIFTSNDQYFTIPQNSLAGQCLYNAPVAFLKNFKSKCLTSLHSCPNGPPLQTTLSDLRVQVRDGQGGVVTVDVLEEEPVDLSQFVTNTAHFTPPDEGQLCVNVTLALTYKFFWQGNGLTNITLTRTVGSFMLNGSVALTTRYSSLFLNGEFQGELKSGKPGYQLERPVIAGFVDTMEINTKLIKRTSINLWKPVSDGLCYTAEMRPVLFGENSTAGCLLPVSLQNLTQCNALRETVALLQATLIRATLVAKTGDPDDLTMTDWVNITFVTLNSSSQVDDTTSSCSGIPSHQHIHVRTIITDMIEGIPQWEIHSLQVSYSLSTWRLECGGGDTSLCMNVLDTQSFPVTSSVTFTEKLINTGPPKTRFQINFTEYDCNRNDVCWPELAFPITRYYTGEPHSQSLAKGLILVFFFVVASVLGTLWRQIRQAWSSASL
ncbi:tectonic-2 [Lampris incognitus]|uniref:tectonic-2 n=1 Tax=Lampris incognitus TaxID=2546036 RepID=UPI0024B4CBD1|nr:tectonic-2 [Lampris incognitus]